MKFSVTTIRNHVKMKKADNITVREAVQVRAILAENLMLKQDHSILCLTGLANDSLVFYVAEGNVGPMIQRMLHERDRMLAANMEWVTFAKLAKLYRCSKWRHHT